MIRWNDNRLNFPKGLLSKAAAPRSLTECAEERAAAEGTDPIDERAADQDHADRWKD